MSARSFRVSNEDGAIGFFAAGDHEDAAADACEALESRGYFAGDPIPAEMEFDVTDMETCETKRVVVTHDYSITWYGREKGGGS